MNQSFSLLIAAALTILPAFAEEPSLTPESEMWNLFYDPPYPTPTEIPADNPLRKELFDQLRVKLEPKAGEPILFSGSLKAYRNWALFQGESQDKKGVPIAFPELGNSDTVALWLRTKDGWNLVDYDGGHSDVFYIVWPEVYGMPKAFFGK